MSRKTTAEIQAPMHVFDCMTSSVVTSDISETVYEAVAKMMKLDVGCIVVVEHQQIVGIITKGDVLKKSLLKSHDPKRITVGKIMSSPVITIRPDVPLEEAAKLMGEKKVTKLPVIDNHKITGIITSTDIIRIEPTQINYLKELVRARFVPHNL